MSIVVGACGQQVSSLRDLKESSEDPWVPIEWVEARSVVSRLTDGSSVEGVVPMLGANEVEWLHSCLNMRDVRLLDLQSVSRLETIVWCLRHASQGQALVEDAERLELLQVWLIARRVRLASTNLAVPKAQTVGVQHFVASDG